MLDVAYSIIKCTPNLKRGELFNIGIIVWFDDAPMVAVDGKAWKRAVAKSQLANDHKSIAAMWHRIANYQYPLGCKSVDIKKIRDSGQGGYHTSLAEHLGFLYLGHDDRQGLLEKLMKDLIR